MQYVPIGCSRVCVFPAGLRSNFRIMVGSVSGLGSTFRAFLGSAQVWVPLSNKIRVRVGSVQHIYGSLRVRLRIFGPVKCSTVLLPEWSTTVFLFVYLFSDSCSWVPCLSWTVKTTCCSLEKSFRSHKYFGFSAFLCMDPFQQWLYDFEIHLFKLSQKVSDSNKMAFFWYKL